MEVLYYRRHRQNDLHIHAFSSAEIFYIAQRRTILYCEQLGSFGSKMYGITFEEELIEEAQKVSQGEEIKDVTISGIKKFDFDKKEIERLIESAELYSKLEEKVRLGIKKLLKAKG